MTELKITEQLNSIVSSFLALAHRPLCQRGARLASGDAVQLGDTATDDRQEPRQIILVGPNNFIAHTFVRII